ncbi:hypothetical protein N7462_010075 [Penicillium macrosclerotiorum]|uniref:uncharacterized protein n=1 Tax=Penicillium macrosclerotiorum TaxID=303699 RepID=UPI00254942FD|nr:uncharacterized protein N7462_010075 [Penicillium macrosclerotiorum]KAJ5669005.1 hypothetical protein N7462_010075 [Penicillium macrosclerotiorum]
MFEFLKRFFSGNTSTHWKRKRASRAYQKKVRARERQLRRQANGEDAADRYFYFSPYANQPPPKEMVRKDREKAWGKDAYEWSKTG